MCWTSSETPIKKKAKKDIPIFKICKRDGKRIRSYYQDFAYKLNTLYTVEIGEIGVEFVFGEGRFTIYEGLHSYSNTVTFTYEESKVISSIRIRSKDGKFIDSILKLNTSSTFMVKVEGIIPSGSIYYINEYGEIISNKIILKKVITLKPNAV